MNFWSHKFKESPCLNRSLFFVSAAAFNFTIFTKGLIPLSKERSGCDSTIYLDMKFFTMMQMVLSGIILIARQKLLKLRLL